jgi:hypothetical protein
MLRPSVNTHRIVQARGTWRLLAPFSLLLAVLAAAGCRAATPDVATYSGQLPRPAIVLVHDFTSLPGEVELYASARSSRKPGSGPVAGAGAATGAAGASTGIGLGADVVVGPRDAESDTRQAARAIAKELAGFFAKQDWISPEQAERYRLIP